VATLALGIGGNTAIFSVVKAVLLEPLPLPESDRLVQVRVRYRATGQEQDWGAYRNAIDWRDQNRSFEHLGIYAYSLLNLSEGGEPEALYGLRVSYDLLPALGVQPALGRWFLPSEDQPGHHHVILLSDEVWRRRFAANPSIVGTSIRLNEEDYIVVGVMPGGFTFPVKLATSVSLPTQRMAFWSPIGLNPPEERRDPYYMSFVGRLGPGVSMAQAQADLDGIAARLERDFPRTNSGQGVRLVALKDRVVGQVRPALLVLAASIALVLLIACANLANLMLARAAGRKREMAMRQALGANRKRLMAQSLVESLVLAMAGGVAGLVLARWGLAALVALNPQNIPRLAEARLDAIALCFTLALSVITGILFGLAPAIQTSGADLQEALRDGGKTTAGAARSRIRDLLIISEVAWAVVLSVGAGLLIQSFARLLRVDPGFRGDHVTAAIVVLPISKYPDTAKRNDFFRQVLGRLEALPGVDSAGAIDALPLSGQDNISEITIEGKAPARSTEAALTASTRFISPGYMRTMGMTLLSGRMLDQRDALGKPDGVVINELASQRFWRGEDPLGKRLSLVQRDGQTAWRQVVGIVKGTHHMGLNEPVDAEIYIPAERAPAAPQFLVVRSALPPKSLTPAIRRAVAAVDPNQPVFLVRSMDDVVLDSVAQSRFSMLLVALFGVLALVLSSVGIYGVISYAVSQRIHEFGIRMALGAGRGDVRRMVLRHGLTLAATGVGLGIIGALAVTRLLSSLLFGVRATDPVTFAAVSLVLIGIALAACYIPPRRATRVDPMVALRFE